MAGNLSSVARGPLIVKGKWFVPTIFIGFVLFTLGMSVLTLSLSKSMKPMLERRQIEAKKAEMEREAKAREAAGANP